jgi:hypothetical protein
MIDAKSMHDCEGVLLLSPAKQALGVLEQNFGLVRKLRVACQELVELGVCARVVASEEREYKTEFRLDADRIVWAIRRLPEESSRSLRPLSEELEPTALQGDPVVDPPQAAASEIELEACLLVVGSRDFVRRAAVGRNGALLRRFCFGDRDGPHDRTTHGKAPTDEIDGRLGDIRLICHAHRRFR